MLMEVRDLGGRLEHVVAQYDRLVRDLFGDEAASSDFHSHVHLVNREIGHVTRRLQEMFVLQYEAGRSKEHVASQQAERGRRERRQIAAVPRVGRPSVVKPFIPAAHRHRVPVMLDSTRISAAQ
jgi:hypothetical protein